MQYKKFLLLSIIVIPSFLVACSMFKLSDGNKTIVGCNHDAWVTEPQLKFTTVGYNAAFTGATRYNGKIAPQSGMNEQGIVFTTLSIFPPQKKGEFKGLPVSDRTEFLESVLQHCRTLEEVELFFSKYDRSSFIRDLFVYIDSTGRVLFVEPYVMHYGNDKTLVQSNFCPSEVSNRENIKQERFTAGNLFIKYGYNTDLNFGRAMIEKMSVSRHRHGDGTLISTVWDNKNLIFDVIFYRDFKTIKRFGLKKGNIIQDTTYSLEQIFPINKKFEELKAYKTPFNTPILRFLLALLGAASGLLGIWFLVRLWSTSSKKLKLTLCVQAAASILSFGYCYILATDISMYYFDFPYIHPNLWWRTAISYTPILLPIPIVAAIFRLKNKLNQSYLSVRVSNIIFTFLLNGFFYWSF